MIPGACLLCFAEAMTSEAQIDALGRGMWSSMGAALASTCIHACAESGVQQIRGALCERHALIHHASKDIVDRESAMGHRETPS